MNTRRQLTVFNAEEDKLNLEAINEMLGLQVSEIKQSVYCMDIIEYQLFSSLIICN
jgi:hypothetical protein